MSIPKAKNSKTKQLEDLHKAFASVRGETKQTDKIVQIIVGELNEVWGLSASGVLYALLSPWEGNPTWVKRADSPKLQVEEKE